MRRAVCLLAALAWTAPAWGDGGLVRISQAAGPWVVTAFSSPTPLRAGPIDLSVLVRDPAQDRTVLDAAVQVSLYQVGGSRHLHTTATHDQATNKLLYAALLELPEPGLWEVKLRITRGAQAAELSFQVEAAAPLPPWRAYWFYFVLPVVGIAVFALHQWLVLHRQGAKR
jgi:hypothetical protein